MIDVKNYTYDGTYARLTRVKQNKTIKDIASEVGVSDRSLHAYETNKQTPNFTTVYRLSKTLGIPLEAFVKTV